MRNSVTWMLCGLAVLIAGCTAYPVYDPYYGYGPDIAVAPPPAPYEYAGMPPAVGYIWIGGYWNWMGASYVWVPGRWEAPRPGYYWMPHRWDHDGQHWHPSGGRWEPDRQRPALPSQVPHVEHPDEHRPLVPPVVRPRPGREPEPERPHPPESKDAAPHSSSLSGKPRGEQRPEARPEPLPRPKPDTGPAMRPEGEKGRQQSDDRPLKKRREGENDR